MKHKHAEVIKQWADGETIQVATIGKEDWTDIEVPTWSLHFEYRVKPPAPKWPETTMTDAQIAAAAFSGKLCNQWRGIANAAIAHACETGQLVLPDPERDMKIAIAAWSAGVNSQSSLELKSIIKEATK